MPSNDHSSEHVDAVHVRFREKGPRKNYYCSSCFDYFVATSILEVFQHYGDVPHPRYHSDCLYCQGKVYQYKDDGGNKQYFHNCMRWKNGIEK